jgi:peptidylprolyl isomerase
MRARTATIALLVAAALGTAACGDSNKTTSTPAAAAPPATETVTTPDVTVETPPATTDTATTPEATTTTPKTTSSKSISKDLKSKPAIPKPTGKAPKSLVVKDIVKGKGATAKAGDAITVQYVGVDFKTGEQFDASWDRGQPFQFQLGAQMVIPGWDQGVAGMKVGGRRELVIPPDLAYGPQGQPPAIAPNATLVFVIDLVSTGYAARSSKASLIPSASEPSSSRSARTSPASRCWLATSVDAETLSSEPRIESSSTTMRSIWS